MKELHILSLGAGVQSSTMLLMALRGEITPLPDAAIFADTQSEPESVYRHLEWLKEVSGDTIPIHVVTAGNLEQEILSALNSAGTGHVGQPPFFVRAPIEDSVAKGIPPDSGGMLWRKCTTDYKIIPIERKARELMKQAGAKHIYQWIGISLDEIHRMKTSRKKYVTKRHPLVEKRMRRSDCLHWLRVNGYPEAPKSACYFCPYISNSRWRTVKITEPETFHQAARFDGQLRTGKLPGVVGDAFVHRSMRPLSEVDFQDDQLDFEFGFDNECEGMCGV